MDCILLRKLAAQIGRHHTAVRADLRRRGYEIREIRTVANQWAHALARQDADKWLRERELEMTVTRRVASRPRCFDRPALSGAVAFRNGAHREDFVFRLKSRLSISVAVVAGSLMMRLVCGRQREHLPSKDERLSARAMVARSRCVALLSPECGSAAHIDEDLRSSAGLWTRRQRDVARGRLAEVQNDGERRRIRARPESRGSGLAALRSSTPSRLSLNATMLFGCQQRLRAAVGRRA
jgi:hypothetical protein